MDSVDWLQVLVLFGFLYYSWFSFYIWSDIVRKTSCTEKTIFFWLSSLELILSFTMREQLDRYLGRHLVSMDTDIMAIENNNCSIGVGVICNGGKNSSLHKFTYNRSWVRDNGATFLRGLHM